MDPASWVVLMLGLAVGSFLNVCIARLPRGESIISPRSRCLHCGRPIPARENIPLLSFFLLRGRCRGCGERISRVYPVVEGTTALLWLLCWWRYGPTAPFLVNLLLLCFLLVLIVIDLQHRLLPDVLTLNGTALGVLLAPLQAGDFLGGPWLSLQEPWAAYAHSLTGAAVGGGFLWLVARLYRALRGREGMGMGDVKMMMMLGAFLGWLAAWMTILLGSLIGILGGALWMGVRRKGGDYPLPFGTFLGAAAILIVLWGDRLRGLYWDLLVP